MLMLDWMGKRRQRKGIVCRKSIKVFMDCKAVPER
jgi:hypothetical protein